MHFRPFGLHFRPVDVGFYHLWPEAVSTASQQSRGVVFFSLGYNSFDGVVRLLKRPSSILLKLKLPGQKPVLLLLDDGLQGHAPEGKEIFTRNNNLFLKFLSFAMQ